MNSENKKAIAIIVPGGIGTGKNNIGVPILERLVKLLAKDFQITVFSLFKINADYKADGFELISISGPNIFFKTFNFFSAFIAHHRRRKFTWIHGFWAMPSGFLAVMTAKLFGIRSVVSILGGDAIALPEINYGQLRGWFPRNLILWTLTASDQVILLTRYLLTNLQAAGLKRQDVKIIPWGVDTSVFTYHEKVQSNPLNLLHIGNLTPVKDQRTLLQAFRIIAGERPCHLTIIGEGTLEHEIRSLAEVLGLTVSITFQAPLPYEVLAGYYHKADILLHTSLSEGQSEVVTEAMSSGVVVCGTNVGLIYDQPECCIVVPVGDHEALANEVLKLLNDPTRFAELRDRAYQWASTHSIHWTVERMASLYD